MKSKRPEQNSVLHWHSDGMFIGIIYPQNMLHRINIHGTNHTRVQADFAQTQSMLDFYQRFYSVNCKCGHI